MPPTKPTDGGLSDVQAMRLAIAQAVAARAAGEVPVGAVLVRDGKLLATGANAPVASHDPTAHAEVLALRAGAAVSGNYRLDGCTLYVTLEPCAMCAGAMLHARLARVVFGAPDPRTGAAGSVTDLFAQPLLNHHTAVEGGMLAEECGTLLQDFFRERRTAQARASEPLREDALRTPRKAFDVPPANVWEGAYRNDLPALEGLRLHHVERGPGDAGPTFVCLHGPADWGLRFASVAETLAGQGARVLVPDLIGFGRSDKPKREDFHRLARHVEMLRGWCEGQGLDSIVLVADENDPALAFALAEALGSTAAGIVLLPERRVDHKDRALARVPHPDRGHEAASRVFAGGWSAEPPAAPVVRLLRLQSEAPDQLLHAVEYFRA